MAEENPSKPNNGLMNAIGDAMDGIGDSYSSIYSTLANAMEKNIQMTEKFNDIMEQTYLHNVKIATELKQSASGIDVILTVHNATQFPILSMRGDLLYDKSKIEACFKESSTLFEAPINLEPHRRHTQTIHFNMVQDKPTFGKGVISLSFPHPINRKELHLQHTFGIYVIDQLVRNRSAVDKSGMLKFATRSYRAKFVRDILEIHPIKGIDVGMCVELSSKNFKFVCEIINFSDDLQFVEIEFFGDPNETELVTRSIEEFNALNDMQ